MKTLLCSIVLIISVCVAGSVFGQGRGQGAGPAGGGGQRGLSVSPAPAGRGPAANTGQPGKAPADAGHANTNKVGREISDNPALKAKLQPLLPSGTNIDDASAGFKNLGEFVAAVHVSKNLDIPFDQLRTRVVTDHQSLGDAIHTLKPAVTKDAANAAVKKAQVQAKEDTKKAS